MKFCLKSGCKNRFSIGSEHDKDSITIICLQCNDVQYKSTEKLKSLIKYFKIIAVIIFLSIIAYFYKDKITQIIDIMSKDNIEQVTVNILAHDLGGTYKSLKKKNSIDIFSVKEIDNKIYFNYKINQNNRHNYKGILNLDNLNADLNGQQYLFSNDEIYFKFVNQSDTSIQYKKNK